MYRFTAEEETADRHMGQDYALKRRHRDRKTGTGHNGTLKEENSLEWDKFKKRACCEEIVNEEIVFCLII